MNKPLCIIYAPVETYSGYGARSRGIVKALLELKKDEWDIKIMSCKWGNTPFGYLDDNKELEYIKEYIIPLGHFPKKPDYMIWITVPNEVQDIGEWNCLITAGIETTICDPSWIEGINRMDLTLVSSQHAKRVFLDTKFEKQDKQTQRVVEIIECTKPVEVLSEEVDLNIFFKKDKMEQNELYKDLNSIKENFCFLFVSHWLQGDFGEDRKNVQLLIKMFLETFKNKPNKPALILKTSGATTSYMDREEILKKIDNIRKTCKGDLPNIYLFHGDIEDKLLNDLYNHPKIKCMVNFTKGEGFGRTLLEFSVTQKPIITSGWSGQLDFLKPEFTTLIQGDLRPIHTSAVVPNILLAESFWFNVNQVAAGNAMKEMFDNYKKFIEGAKRQSFYSKTNFSYDKLVENLGKYLDNFPKVPQQSQFVIPSINKPTIPNFMALPK